jgi:hypothetical protein
MRSRDVNEAVLDSARVSRIAIVLDALVLESRATVLVGLSEAIVA